MSELKRPRPRRLLIGLAVLFFAPLGLSFYLYYGHSRFQPSDHVNHGELIEPVRPMPATALPLQAGGASAADLLQHKWTLLYVNIGPCTEVCRRKLYETRQVHTALDRDMGRVQRVFVATADCCEAQFLPVEHPDLMVVRAEEAASLLAALPKGAGFVYIVDPLGNLMMAYAPDAPPKGLLEDMKRLLKLSHVG